MAALERFAVDALTIDVAVARGLDLLDSGHGGQVVTLNPEMLMRARHDPVFREIIARAALVTADGMGVVWAARLAGVAIPQRVAGIDFAVALMERAASSDHSVFLLGAGEGVAEAAARTLASLLDGVRVVGFWRGVPGPLGDGEAISRIRESDAHILLVAYGSPAQDYWIARNLRKLPGVLAIGVGGALDVWGGRVARAPRWMRGAGLEWVYRLAREPWRWRRMCALPAFGALAIVRALRTRLLGAPTLIIARPNPPTETHGEYEDESH
jgi:N-acetylglucosaminyldiphosphoundecaprenol N-acetyl-beta-D-mannosaminyltransferase